MLLSLSLSLVCCVWRGVSLGVRVSGFGLGLKAWGSRCDSRGSTPNIVSRLGLDAPPGPPYEPQLCGDLIDLHSPLAVL